VISQDRHRTPWARVTRVLPLDAATAWALVADARNHARWVPLTRVDLGPPGTPGRRPQRRPAGSAPQVGDEVVAVSGPLARRGAPGLVDRMSVERFEAPLGAVPGVAVFVKRGPVLLGTGRIEVAEAGPSSARVTWSETVHLRGLPPAVTRWPAAVLLDLMLGLVLRRAVRDARRTAAQRSAA
jgi:hypothetical protein